ncbi:MAG TPA: xanthine dehydrogenase family protein molybdopterin-binding subunit [Candidatus Dormibacteraeota bacterium]|nr:xanthine dehydrogenase family protein molybdopterin-binding subunit [Candidatus Dormibacteraeota bacterium]
MAVTQLVGAKIHRREDPRLITGHGHYIDDFVRQGTAYAAFVRSPHAHARIKSIDVTDASKAPGVVGVYTARDFKGQLAGTHPAAPAFVADKKYIPERFPIAEKEVCYQGEIVAAVLADTKGQASDAANMIQVDYAELPAVMDLEKALEDGSPKAHEGGPDNVCWDLTYAGPEVTEAAFQEADTVVKQRILQNRLAPVPMEPRGVMAEYEGFDKKLTIWMSSQNPHFIRLFVSGAMGLKESQVRVISPDVGGGFGSKISPYPEDYLVPALSRIADRPVKWIETRTESIQNATHGRGQFYDVEVAAKKDGTLLGMRVTQYLDVGAYCGTFSAFQACACLMAGGAYKWKGISARTIGILTNRVPTDPYRGAGRPEATHLVERMVDLVAAELKMDPVDIRKKNFIQPGDFPYTQNFGLVIDSGDYEKSLDVALKLAGYDELRKKQAEGRKQGKYIGIGLSTWIELCGFGPSAATAPATGGIALVESAQVRVVPTGSVLVYTGTHAHGQGHETTFSQIVADQLGIPIENIEIRHGDTAEGTSFGYGTYGSRSLAVGGVAVSKAVGKVIDKGKKLAAHMLEAAEEDVVYENGSFHVKGSPDRAKAFGEVAFASYGMSLPEGMEQGLEAVAYFDPPNLVWPFGAHIALVEVDAETGDAQLQKYVAVDDCGNIINPMIVDGQIHGGVAQAIAQALYEEVVYDDETGQLKTGTLLDYNIPGMGEIPIMELDHTVTPSPTNDLGVKGIGEAGTIAASAAVINAVCDALSPLGIKHVDMPASPDRLWKQMKEARQ